VLNKKIPDLKQPRLIAKAMKILRRLFLICISLSILISCSVSGYITDPQSIERQKKMHSYRTGVNIGEGFLVVASTIVAAFTGLIIYPEPKSRSYKKLIIASESKDTLFVNMVTDWQWKDSTYFDIRDIIIPPLQTAKVIVPVGIAYNVYFRNDFNAPDDEKIEINTFDYGRLRLKPEKEKSLVIPTN